MAEEEEEGIGIISDGALGLGELARLTVNNEAEAAYDVSTSRGKKLKKQRIRYHI